MPKTYMYWSTMTIQDGNIYLGRKGQFGNVNIGGLKGGIKKANIKSADQIKLFEKIDSDKNGILTSDEIQNLQNSLGAYAEDGKITKREARKLLKENGLKGQVNNTEIFGLLQQLGVLAQDIANTSITKTKSGIELINVEYQPKEDGSVVTDTLIKQTGALSSQKTVKDGTSVTQYFDKQGNVRREVTVQNGVTTTVNYDTAGNVTSTTRQKGSVTEYLNAEGQVTKKVTDKGSGVQETVEFEYDAEGNVAKESKTNADGTKVVSETHEDGTKIATEYDASGNIAKTTKTNTDGTQIIDDGKTITTINPDGTKSVENIETGEIQNFDKDGNLIQPEPESHKHAVQAGDTWYGIVQAKYGITDHKQTMEIVRQLKNHNGVNPSATNIPKEIELPATVTLTDGTEVKIADIDAKVDTSHNNITNANHSANKVKGGAETEEVQARNAALRNEGAEIATALFEDMKGIGTKSTFNENLTKITKDNVASVVLAYREVSPDESLTEAIFDEFGRGDIKNYASVKDIFEKLEAKGKEIGIDTQHFRAEFEKVNRFAGRANFDELDSVIEGMAAAINGAAILTTAEATEVRVMSPAQQKEFTVDVLNDTQESAQNALDSQKKYDGWAGKTVDWMSQLWDSENRNELVQKDLDTFKSQIADLKNTGSEAEFKAKFKETFGIDYNPYMIKAYEKRQEQLINATSAYGMEQLFNESLSVLLENDKLTEETQYIPGAGQYGGAGTYVTTATKEQVYEREFTEFAKLLGGEDNVQAGIEELNAQLKSAGLNPETASLEEKYAALHTLAKGYGEALHKNTMRMTENKGFEAFKNECDATYNAAFGTTNDIAKRVEDYNTSQQAGAMILKSTVKAGASIGLAAIPGVGIVAAAAGTTVISAAVDITDRTKSEVGLQEGELGQILKNAAIDGATVLVGGGITKAVANTSKAVKFSAQMAGDLAVGAAAEYIQTSRITLEGLATQAAFSLAGNVSALKGSKGVEIPTTPDAPTPIIDKAGGIADGVAARSIDQSHVSANQRKMIADALEDVPTPQEVDAFQKALHGEPLTPQQRADLDAINAQASTARAKASQIGENIDPNLKAKLEGTPQIDAPSAKASSPEIKGLEGDIRGLDKNIQNLEGKIKGMKKMGKNTQALEKQLEGLKQQRKGKLTQLDNLTKAQSNEIYVDPHHIELSEAPKADIDNNSARFEDFASDIDSKPATGSSLKNATVDNPIVPPQFKPISTVEEASDLYKKIIDGNWMGEVTTLRDGQPVYRQGTDGWVHACYKNKPGFEQDPIMKMNGVGRPEQGTKWKMHLYADNPQEWANVAQIAMPYLNSNTISYKTINGIDDFVNLTGTQKGKSFTIYFENEEQFLRAAQDLNERFSASGLKSSGKVGNEAQIGDSGFISYRHEDAQRGGLYKPDSIEDPYLKMLEKSTPRSSASSVNPLQRPLTSEDRMAMGAISTDINRAKTAADIQKAGESLNKIPDSAQRSHLVKQLEKKANDLGLSVKFSALDTMLTFEGVEVTSEINNAPFA